MGIEDGIQRSRRELVTGGIEDTTKAIDDLPTREEAERWMHDGRGMNTMTDEVRRRAMGLVPYASEKLREAVGQQAADNFRIKFEVKKSENQAKYDIEAQVLLNELKSRTPISEILPEVAIPPASESEVVATPETPPAETPGDSN